MAGRVLIVEDDPEVLAVERALVEEDLGLAVDEAASVHEALDAARRNPPDVVILDLMLPDGDGSEVLTAMRKDQRLEAVPVMVVTAMTGAEDRRRVIAAGAADIMYKPFDARAFVGHVAALLSKLPGSGSATPSSR